MATGLHDRGEEYINKVLFEDLAVVASIDVGLFNDTTDALVDADDVSAITTEPSGGSYTRQTVSIPADITVSQAGGDWQSILADVVFDTSDSSESVDSYFVVVNFQGNGDGATTDHLFFTGDLDQTYDLGSVDSFTLSGAGVSTT